MPGNFWNTEVEIEFLKNLGKHIKDRRSRSRRQLLEGYLNGALKRTDWGGMDQDRIIKYAERELARESRRRG